MIVESRATASHRYYMNKKKDDIVYRIRMMRDQLKSLDVWEHQLPPEVIIDKVGGEPGWLKREHTREQLASIAMEMHELFPEDKDNG